MPNDHPLPLQSCPEGREGVDSIVAGVAVGLEERADVVRDGGVEASPLALEAIPALWRVAREVGAQEVRRQEWSRRERAV